MTDLAKKIIFSGVFLYFVVKFGQNLFDFGSDFRKDFYFVGMDMVSALFAFALFKLHNSIITRFWLWFCISAALNQLFFKGNITYLEISIGVLAVILNIRKN